MKKVECVVVQFLDMYSDIVTDVTCVFNACVVLDKLNGPVDCLVGGSTNDEVVDIHH